MTLPLIRALPFSAAGVYPNVDAVGGRSTLISIIGALLTITLVVACLMLIICAITWAVSSSAGNYQTASKARLGVLVAVAAAALAGGAVTWMNFLLGLGSTL